MPDHDPRQRPDDTGGWPALPIGLEWDEAHDVRDSANPLPWRVGRGEDRQEPTASER